MRRHEHPARIDVTASCVRVATAADVPRLRELVERAYRGESARRGWTHEADLLHDARTSEAELLRAIDDDGSQVLLAEVAGTLVGTVTIRRTANDRAYLGMLCVDPDRQAAGAGRTLLAEAERRASASFGAKVMEMTVIDVRTDLIAWYERRGYARSGETRPFPTGDGFPFRMVVLERHIG